MLTDIGKISCSIVEQRQPGDNAGCSGILQQAACLRLRLTKLTLNAHIPIPKECPSQLQTLKNTSFCVALVFCYVYLRLAQEKHYFLTLDVTNGVLLPAFDQAFVIDLSSCTVPET